MTNFVLFGKPGAGKGTQAAFLKTKYNLVHISTGDLFRYNIKNETELGTLAKSFMDRGDLVPDQVTIDMLEAEVDRNPQAHGFIFDGFPRTESQAAALDVFLAIKEMNITATVALEADDDILVAKIRNRFEEYNQKTAPLKKYYEGQNKFHSINGIGSIEEITERLTQLIDRL